MEGKIDFIPRQEREAHKFTVTGDLYLEGRLYATQPWATEPEKRRAINFLAGNNRLYSAKEGPMGYRFRDREGRECILIGDGHHRTGESIVEGKGIGVEIDADLGVLTPEILVNPHLAAQKLAVLGLEGIWPFQTFMDEFTAIRFRERRKR